jgi:hypothetical protein
MRILAIVTSVAVLLGAGYASAATMTSGRPSAVLTRAQCKAVWKVAVPSGHYLYRQNAHPFISISNWLMGSTRTDDSPSTSSRRPAS